MSNSSAIVCDLDGVLFNGTSTIPGAGEAVMALAGEGHHLVFATNNSTKTPSEVAARISASTGYDVSDDQVVTSAMATAHYLAETARLAFVIGEQGLIAALQDADITVVDDLQNVDAVVVGLDRGVTYEKLAIATLAVRRGARLIATNTDATFPSPRGQVPGAGTFVAAVERATGAIAEPCGKPHEPMAALVQSVVGDHRVVMVGDRIETDVEFGRRHGWTTVLVLTGVTSATEAAAAPADFVIESLADLPGML